MRLQRTPEGTGWRTSAGEEKFSASCSEGEMVNVMTTASTPSVLDSTGRNSPRCPDEFRLPHPEMPQGGAHPQLFCVLPPVPVAAM